MTIALPLSPGPRSVEWQLQDFGGDLVPGLGGAVQTVNRLGNRWTLRVELPPMTPQQAAQWMPALTRAVEDGAEFRIRQPGLDIGYPGNPVVDGSGAAGYTLPVRGCTPGYIWRAGQWLSLTSGGQKFAYQVAALAVADASGDASLSLSTRLRAEPADGDAINAGAPVITGSIRGDGRAWTIDALRVFGTSFTIAEKR